MPTITSAGFAYLRDGVSLRSRMSRVVLHVQPHPPPRDVAVGQSLGRDAVVLVSHGTDVQSAAWAWWATSIRGGSAPAGGAGATSARARALHPAESSASRHLPGSRGLVVVELHGDRGSTARSVVSHACAAVRRLRLGGSVCRLGCRRAREHVPGRGGRTAAATTRRLAFGCIGRGPRSLRTSTTDTTSPKSQSTSARAAPRSAGDWPGLRHLHDWGLTPIVPHGADARDGAAVHAR